jgi:hypothetical protein
MRRIDVNARGPQAENVEAWVSEPEAATGDPARLDDRLLARATASVRPLLQAAPGAVGPLERRYEIYRAAGSPAAIRLSPLAYPLEPWVLSPIPEWAQREDCCLVIDTGEQPAAATWSAVVRFARHYPGLPMLILGMPIDSPATPRALDACPNLVLEARSPAGLAALCDSHGTHRFAYGSGGSNHQDFGLRPGTAEAVALATASELANGTWGVRHL